VTNGAKKTEPGMLLGNLPGIPGYLKRL